jgi:hypothetical protein
VRTKRLNLIPLTLKQLSLYLADPQQLEENVHTWYTYWLVVIAQEPFGAGLAGFKGYPSENEEVEIGYGIGPGKGFYLCSSRQRFLI